MNEIKESITSGTISDKLDLIKKVPVLILDDIGAENLSPWTRDEILGTILQFRASEKLPTIYSSNLNLEELTEYFAYTHKNGSEMVKAYRLMERIIHYVKPLQLGGKNRRADY